MNNEWQKIYETALMALDCLKPKSEQGKQVTYTLYGVEKVWKPTDNKEAA